ncbi:MAG: pilus assembly protein PilM [Lentisphaeria bacterium]|nr:pilus assembly protein PilM [Lentisphaeria bacterium]
MAKENRVLAIDVGADSLKMAEFTYTANGGMVMDKFAFRRIDVPVEGEEEPPTFAEIYNSMLAEYGFTAKSVRLSLSVQSAFLRLSKLPAIMGSTGAIAKVVEYEAKQTVPYAMNEVEWDYQLLLHQWEESRDVTDADGNIERVTESKEEYEALFTAMKTDNITPYTDAVLDSGKRVESVTIAPVALYNAASAANQITGEECVMLLNIGSRATSLIIADGKRVFLRSIPIAGYTITSQIAKEFSIKISEAEDLKRRYGFVALGGAYEEPESELAAMISKISRNVMTRLHGEISRSINVWRSTHGGRQPGRVLLAGGGSTMTYVPEFFNEKLRIDVQYLNTFAVTAIGSGVEKEELQSTALTVQELLGTALEAMPNLPVSISLLPRAIRKQHELDRRKPYLYASSAILIVCLLFTAVAIRSLRGFNEERVKRVQAEVSKTEAKQREINALMGELNSNKGGYESLRNYITQRNQWGVVMNELNRLTPDTMWYTMIEGLAEPPPAPNADGSSPDEQNSNSGSGDGESRDSAQAQLTRISAVSEIKYLRLRGCTLILAPNATLQEQGFKESLKDNPIFESADFRDRRVVPGTNLTGFDMIVKLRNPIKK